MSNDISNNDMLAAIDKRFDDVVSRLGSSGGAGNTWTVVGPVNAPSLTGEPGADNQPFQVKPGVVRMPPIAEVVEMIPTRENGWLNKGYQQQPSLRMWLTNNLRNWELHGGNGTPDYVGSQLMGLAVAHMNQWLDVGTGVNVLALVTSLVDHYAAWQKDQAK